MLKIRNNTSFPIILEQFMKNIKWTADDPLLYHQRIVLDYVMAFPKLRGILLYHEMGAGKSILAISICEAIYKEFPQYKKIFLVPKSLQENIRLNMAKINVKSDDYTFISSNANNLAEQLVRQFYNLERSIVVIDEAHNLFNALVNGSKNAVALYELLMNTKELKCILLTGTPVINDPFELALMMNAMNGYVYYDHLKETPFSEYYDSFKRLVVDKLDENMKKKFIARILGFVSYYNYKEHVADTLTKGANASTTVTKTSIPIKLERQNIEIPMSKEQFVLYAVMKKKEEESVGFTTRVTNTKFTKQMNVASSYKINTRQICNMLYPEEAVKEGKHFYDKLPEIFYTDIKKYSPKIFKVFEIINKHSGEKGYLYSQFIDCGLKPIGEFLKRNGFEEYLIEVATPVTPVTPMPVEEKETPEETDIPVPAPTPKSTPVPEQKAITKPSLSSLKKKRFCYLTGEVDEQLKNRYLSVFNSPQNANGEIISLILVSSVGAQGITLLCVRYCIVFEPYWNYIRIDQVENRGVRIDSHKDLPEEKRNITPYLLIAKTLDKTPSTDEIIWTDALKKQETNNEFLELLKQGSIDCSIHSRGRECFKCMPTNSILFDGSIEKDINRCETFVEENVNVKEIIINKEKYYYSVVNKKIRIFRFNKELNQYEEMFVDNPIYETIYNKVKSTI